MKPSIQNIPPSLLLGTAMWGWTTTKETVFQLLDEWYSQGFRQVDTATNYPIDKNPEHFRLAENILLEWIKANGITDLRLMMKIGSVNNLFTPEHILTKSFVLMMLDEYQNMFGSNLETMMVHWDNRDVKAEIKETFEALETIENRGLKVGLSGIKHPEIYAELNEGFNLGFSIQVKHNLLQSAYPHYAPFHRQRRFIAYGINAGGIKLDAAKYAENSSLRARGGDVENEPPIVAKIRGEIKNFNEKKDRPAISAFHQIGMINAFYHADIQGILLGASKLGQLRESIGFYRVLQEVDYSDVSAKLAAK
ncbi:MAG TPA: hypothetical protein ENJ95_17620 [Bacteroidetes bacterium]|nr:hypothetical protein [Bacteroidota bacterium]